MESWTAATSASPSIKFEASPAESFLSVPGDMYPPLFGSCDTMNPLEIMTPESFSKETSPDFAAGPAGTSEDGQSEASSDKKPTKKRKSWGQVLPEPKTNLPPRKRAKTDDEKEQRRVERVLRNRRAAQSSRERKRLEVEALEQKNKQLEALVGRVMAENKALAQELASYRGNSNVSRNPITFSQELFSSHDGHRALVDQPLNIDNIMMSTTTTTTTSSNTTVNPASLSPCMSPIPEALDEDEAIDDDEQQQPQRPQAVSSSSTQNAPAAAQIAPAPQTSPDLAQHPAAMLSSDLQCQSAEVSRSWTTVSQQQQQQQAVLSPALALYYQLTLLLTCTSNLLLLASRPLTQIAISMKAGSSLRPTPALLNTIILLVTRPSSRVNLTSISTSSSTTIVASLSLATSLAKASSQRPLPRPSPALRLKVLRKILTCSPMLARPLVDATVAALRLVQSEESSGVVQVGDEGSAGAVSVEEESFWTSAVSPDGRWLDAAALPSSDVLLALLWAIIVEQRRLDNKEKTKTAATLPPRITRKVIGQFGRVSGSGL